jgi:hypothetical protein
MPKPPIDPDSFDKVNFVIDSWTTGCDAPWYIYVETMKPAAIEAFFALLAFGMGDVIRGALRPGGLGHRTRKRKRKWAKYRPSFPELGNLIGKQFPIAEQIEDFTRWGTGTRTLWRIDTAMQAGLFLWLVADIAEDFAFNWTSLLYESYWCQPDPPGKFSFHNTTGGYKQSGVWKLAAYFVEDYSDGPPGWFGLAGTSGPTGCTVAATKTFKKVLHQPQPTNVSIQIRNSDTGKVIAQTDSDTPEANGDFSLPVSGTIPPNTAFRVYTKHEPSWADIGWGVVVGVANAS